MLIKISDTYNIHRKANNMIYYSDNSKRSDMNREKNIQTDHSISEISMPKESVATDIIPDEVPRKDGPSGRL